MREKRAEGIERRERDRVRDSAVGTQATVVSQSG